MKDLFNIKRGLWFDINAEELGISQAKAELGWKPGIKLDDGLIPTIEYFRTL